jgi:uncharacterized membrane protein
MIEYPGEGQWSLVFICTPPGAIIAGHLSNEEHISVFLPCTPNPTTGFYFFLPSRDVIELPISPDDAVKLIVSCGVIQPDTHAVVAEAGSASLLPRKRPRGACKQIEPMSGQT